MTEEFSLSKKIWNRKTINLSDVKEFIKIINENYQLWFDIGGLPYVIEKLNKLAGDDFK